MTSSLLLTAVFICESIVGTASAALNNDRRQTVSSSLRGNIVSISSSAAYDDDHHRRLSGFGTGFGYGLLTLILVILFGAAGVYFWYKSNIAKHQKELADKLARGLVYREKKTKKTKGKVVKALELHPEFVKEQTSKGWQLSSLGQYLNTLRFFVDEEDGNIKAKATNAVKAKILEKELNTAIAAMLMHALGPGVGAAILPAMGTGKAESLVGTIADQIVSYVIANVLTEDDKDGAGFDPLIDIACQPMNMMELSSFINFNQKLRKETNMVVSPIEWMKCGEVGWSPTYHAPANIPITAATNDKVEVTAAANNKSAKQPLIPNPFIIKDHFDLAIHNLEDEIRNGGKEKYDPDDRSTPEPIPMNPTILPDLYAGWGGAKVTHTKREILRNRLISVLLTKLSYNYKRRANNDEDDEMFVVRIQLDDRTTKDCCYPDEFVDGLIKTGHTVEVCPRSAMTTFGISTCIKEDDGSWTNVPIGFFFRTGYERSSDQRAAYFNLPHGGMDMKIEGPLIGIDRFTGKSCKCDVQFYIAIEGMCGWHSNHNTDVPWIKSVSTTEIYTNEQALSAVRMSGILACVLNSISTDMSLPFGGYGLLGVCCDTAAVVDYAVRGATNMYPMLSTGRYLMHTTNYLSEFVNKLQSQIASSSSLMNKDEEEVAVDKKRDYENEEDKLKQIADDAHKIASAAGALNSDVHCTPSEMIGATRRFLANYPTSYFQITEDSRQIMELLSNEHKEFLTASGNWGIPAMAAATTATVTKISEDKDDGDANEKKNEIDENKKENNKKDDVVDAVAVAVDVTTTTTTTTIEAPAPATTKTSTEEKDEKEAETIKTSSIDEDEKGNGTPEKDDKKEIKNEKDNDNGDDDDVADYTSFGA